MKEARIFKAWKQKVTGDLTNTEDPVVRASLKMFKDITTTLEQTLLVAFLHETRLKPSQIEMLYSHSPEGMLVTVRERVEASKTPEATQQFTAVESCAGVSDELQALINYGN